MHIVKVFRHSQGARVHIPRAYLNLLGLNIGDYVAWDVASPTQITLRNATAELKQKQTEQTT